MKKYRIIKNKQSEEMGEGYSNLTYAVAKDYINQLRKWARDHNYKDKYKIIKINPSPSAGSGREKIWKMKMKNGDRLLVVQNGEKPLTLRVIPVDGESRTFCIGNAVEALKYLLLDEEGRKAKNEYQTT